MGLAVETGSLAFLIEEDEEGAEWIRESISSANAVLVELNLPTHDEPESLPELNDWSGESSFPYSFLHKLRRAYAHSRKNPDKPLVPCGPDEDAASDPVVDELTALFDSHLLCHSDCEGFYFPIDFSQVVIDESGDDRIEGGMLGSSLRLHEELIALAPHLGINASEHLSDSELKKIEAVIEAESDFWVEKLVWLSLFEACRFSKKHGTAIHFG